MEGVKSPLIRSLQSGNKAYVLAPTSEKGWGLSIAPLLRETGLLLRQNWRLGKP
jgi:hypothetical protein